jgi:hypothetical protein
LKIWKKISKGPDSNGKVGWQQLRTKVQNMHTNHMLSFSKWETPTEDIIFTFDISPQLVVFDWVLLYWSQALLDSQEVLVGNGFTLGS